MAKAILRLFDSGGDEVVAPIAFGAAAPGVPTAEQTFTIRNNDGGASPVDTGLGVHFVVTSKVAGSSNELDSLGNSFADAAAAQSRVISFSGGATGDTTGFRRSPLKLGNIPDGGQIEIGVQIRATAASATSGWELSFALEDNPFVPLRDMGFTTIGNFVYNGQGGGFYPDPDFTSIETVTGAFDAGAADDTIDLPTLVRYYIEGLLLEYEPAPATLTFDDLDGAAAALLAGEYYWAGLSLDETATLVTTKGLKATLPEDDADKPTLPDGPVDMVFVAVPFGLGITNIEQIFELGFFQEEQTGGRDVTIHRGEGASAGFWSRIETPVELTLADNEVSTTWLLPGNAIAVTVAGTPYPSERRSLKLWRHTTAAGVITVTEDLRKIGASRVVVFPDSICASMGFTNPLGASGPHLVIDPEGIFVGVTNLVTIFESGGVIANPAANNRSTPSASFTLNKTGIWESLITINAFAGGPGDVILAAAFVNDVDSSADKRFEFAISNDLPGLAGGHGDAFYNAGDEVDLRLTNSVNDGTTDISFVNFQWTMTLKVEQ